MSAFKALNVDAENEPEDEVDNTKEIQIEDALKLYQTALKYHSEGPSAFDQAAQAYKALFESEIFTYTEAYSEYKRHELFGDSLVFDSILDDDFETSPAQVSGGNESAPNTLPQIIHLSYKNYGQFLLEMIHHYLRQPGAVTPQQRQAQAISSLEHFATALDKDEADLDLWLRSSSVAAMLESRRITRFCLEAVLDGDDDSLNSIMRLPGLEEGFAGQQLRELVDNVQDALSLMQAPLSSMKRKKLSEAVKKRLNPFPFAPLPSEAAAPSLGALMGAQSGRIVLNLTKWDWAGAGEAILHHYLAEQGGYFETAPGSSLAFNIPPDTAVVDNGEQQAPAAEDVQADVPVPDVQPAVEETATPTVGTNPPMAKDSDDVVMEDEEKEATVHKESEEQSGPQEPPAAQSRKRSTDSAGLPESAEGGRSRSKRIRARGSIIEEHAVQETAGPDLAKQMEEQLSPVVLADQYLFEIINDMFAKLGVAGLGSPQALRDAVTGRSSEALPDEDSITKASRDMFTAIQEGGAKIAAVLLSGESVDLGGMTREAGLNAFLGYAKAGISQSCTKPMLENEGLGVFAQRVNSEWLSVKEVALLWVEHLLRPDTLHTPNVTGEKSRSTYMQYRWSEELKRHLVQIIVNFDDFIYEQLLERIDRLQSRILRAQAQGLAYVFSEHDVCQTEMAETLFELHLDIYSLIKHPHSGVDTQTQIVQNDRLGRWSALARDILQIRTECDSKAELDELSLRHIWASVFHMSVSEDSSPDYTVSAMEELKALFKSTDGPAIEIQNNAVMPELSIAAVDRELARIGMKDFFLKVFNPDERDPVAVIESLEPVLEPIQEQHTTNEPKEPPVEDGEADSRSSSTLSPPREASSSSVALAHPSPFQEMKKFLDTASVSLRLSLWQRLREAYEGIDYQPKVVSCYLRSIETLVGEFKSPVHMESPEAERQVKLLSRLRILDEVLVKTLQLVKGEETAFDCLPYEHLQSSMSAISELLRIMSAANILEDMLRIGQFPNPTFEGCPNGTLFTITTKLHDMQLRAWILQYYLLKEGISQNPEAFPTQQAVEDQFEFIRHVHYATGMRGFCHAAGRTFLRLAKDELLRLDDVADGNTRDTELAQILYDLYGLKTFINPLECHEFGSTPDMLDKKTATSLLSFILSQARKVSIKDLPKTELKVTIDKVHGALGRPKTNEDISLNRKVLTAYFKSPINPIALFKGLKGVATLSTKRIPAEAAVAASKGWLFMMGNVALNKFRSQKRLVPGPTEDVNFAQAFFLQDLEFSVENWETWYRLAQAYDTQIEEAVSWSAEKLNSNSVELIHQQRAAIHCYIMAVACAVRDADVDPRTLAKVSGMYTDFGNRIYASSREPFSMNAFELRENERKWYSGSLSQIVYQSTPFHPLSPRLAWKLASTLFKRAIGGSPDKWWNHFMLGKSLWKMYCAYEAHVQQAQQENAPLPDYRRTTWEETIAAFVNAVETLPDNKKERKDPVLEPHYKLVSVVHKLFVRKAINHEKGEDILRHSAYTQNIKGPENPDDWERFVLAVLKALRDADKTGWHHRMTARAAHVIYDDNPNDMMVAYAAKQELTKQMFTKTMSLTVWKPENERPGRHFVYTARYTQFFVKLLVQTNDRTNLEALARRTRRKQHEYYEHSKLWQELCQAYLKLLRRVGNIPEGHEEAVFKSLNNEEFQAQALRVEAWCQRPESQHPVLDVLREVIELKRLNNGLMKVLLIDDLIGDTYAVLYATIGPTLAPLPSQQPPLPQPEAGVSAPHSLAQDSIGARMQVTVDGASDAPPNPNTPFALYNPSQLSGTPQPEATTKPRAKAVGRREIQRKAEAAVVKPAAPAAIVPSGPMPIRSPPANTHPQVVIATPARPAPSSTEMMPRAGPLNLQVPPSGTATAAGSVTNAESSVPASLHDSADDESELSELDEEEVQEIHDASDVRDPLRRESAMRPLFPNPNEKKAEDKAMQDADAGQDGSHGSEEKAHREEKSEEL